MKGYVMILYVNAAILGLIAVASLGYGLILHREYNHCREDGNTHEACAASQNAANATYRIAPFLLVVAIVLFTIAFMAKPATPAATPPDTEPTAAPATPATTEPPNAPPTEPPPPAP